MLTIVHVVCSFQRVFHAHAGAMNHVQDWISVFLVDLYHISLIQSVQLRSLCCLEQQLGPHFGKSYAREQVLLLLCTACGAMGSDLIKPGDVAASHGHLMVVKWIVENFPSLCTERASEFAAANGHLAVVEFLLDHDLVADGQAIAEAAVRHGIPSYELVATPKSQEFDQAKGLQILDLLWRKQRIDCIECLMEEALVFGAMNIVHWLEELLNATPSRVCNKRNHLSSSANTAIYNRLEMKALVTRGGLEPVKWVLDRLPQTRFDKSLLKCALSSDHDDVALVKLIIDRMGQCPESLDLAVENGNLKIVKYLHNKYGSRLTCAEWAIDCAIANGHMQMIKWLYENRQEDFSWTVERVCDADTTGTLAIVQFLVETCTGKHRIQVCQDMLVHTVGASGNCHHETIMYLFGELKRMKIASTWLMKCDGVVDAVVRAIKAMNLDAIAILQLRHDQDGHQAIKAAACWGDLRLIQHFHEQRSESFTTEAMDVAAERGWLAIVCFLHDFRNEGCTTQAMDGAAAEGYLQVVEFLTVNRCEGCTHHAMDRAAANGHLRVVQFLHFHRQEGCSSKATTEAAKNGHLEVVKFLLSHRCEPTDAVQSMKMACQFGEMDVVTWLLESRDWGEGQYEEFVNCAKQGVVGATRRIIVLLARHCNVTRIVTSHARKKLKLVNDRLG